MNSHLFRLALISLYCLLVYVIYATLPPAYSVEVTLVPATYMHIQQDVTTRSRVASMVQLPSFEVAIGDLRAFYKECKKAPMSTVRVFSAANQSPEIYKFVISDSTEDISLEHIQCAIDLMGKEQGALRQWLVSGRTVNPPAGLETDTVSLIAAKRLTELSTLKALARSAVLGLVLVVLLYAFGKFFLQVRSQDSTD